MDRESSSPVSFPVSVARLPAKGMPVRIEADGQQREALAAAHGLDAVRSFAADLTVTAWKKGGVRVAGSVRAEIVQSCVVTLEPVDKVVEEEVSALFLPEGSKLATPRLSDEGEVLLDAEGEDAPELFTGDRIDVGQLAEEFFALGIDPYPRKEGVALDATPAEDGQRRGPMFDQLKQLRKKD